MTTAHQFGNAPRITSADTAFRLRGLMGSWVISRPRLCEASGMNRMTLARKLDGVYPFTIEEATLLADTLGQSHLWVLAGIGEPLPPPMRLCGLHKVADPENDKFPGYTPVHVTHLHDTSVDWMTEAA